MGGAFFYNNFYAPHLMDGRMGKFVFGSATCRNGSYALLWVTHVQKWQIVILNNQVMSTLFQFLDVYEIFEQYIFIKWCCVLFFVKCI